MANGKDLGIRGIRRIQNFPVQSGATFKQGDFLVQTATGVAGPPAPGNDYDTTTNKIVGRACCDSTRSDGTAYTSVGVEVAETGTQFCVSLFHTTPATAVPTAAMLVPGTYYALRNVAGPYPAVNISTAGSTAANQTCRIVEPDPNDTPSYPMGASPYAVTVPGANVWIEFNRTATANPGPI